ncbi:MAG: PCRF domain-containing protein, partial [Alphaproteobacteria bacterium]
MIPQTKLKQILDRHAYLEHALAQPDKLGSDAFVKMSREYAELSDVAAIAKRLAALRRQLADAAALKAEAGQDQEMRQLAEAEIAALEDAIRACEHELSVRLLPKDVADARSAILEIRAGTGGHEAALFAGDLFRMYQRYAETQGWRVEVLSASPGEVGGYKEVIAAVAGQGVFAKLKFESGVHRVQRVPTTEAGGRIHTSAATVAVLPEAEDVDVQIDEKDLRIDVFRASGPGGQSVNT